jgi:phospholipid/cholesterol/gamma-HCH transport system substrate-binding protein
MLTRFVRIQLTIFTIASIVGVLVMVFTYMQVPTLLGIGHITVTLELPATGGLYRFSNVTYRGVQIGKVTSVALTDTGAKATLSLDTSPRVPTDLQADVRSISAVGEQYVDLRPRTTSGPYLRDGSVIPARDTTIPQDVGPLLDQTSALISSIPKDKLHQLLDESFQGLNGSGYDLGSLFDSSATVSHDINGVADRAATLFNDTAPLLDTQADTTDEIRTWARSLAGVTGQVVTDDPHVRTILHTGTGAAQEASRLLAQVKPTLPVLLANLVTIGQVAVTYRPALEELLVLLPPFAAATQSFNGANNYTGQAQGDFLVTVADPPVCTVGFLPPNQWRSPADTSEVDTPDGLYCKLPQDSPIGVRGARNYPCLDRPGKRAPTVDICESDRPYEPIAMRQHALGPYQLDPNLLAQGVPPDDRVTFGDNEYAPVEGTPMGPPPGSAPLPGPVAPPPSLLAPPVPVVSALGPPPGPPPAGLTGGAESPAPGPPASDVPAPPADTGALPAAPSGLSMNGSAPGPSVAVAQYDSHTGRYVGPDGHLYQESDLVNPGATKTWKDLIFTPQT